jgi:hypothetical protein
MPRLACTSDEEPGESRPFSLFLPLVESSSCFIGLEGMGASLLGMGVMDGGGLEKAVFESFETGVFLTVAGVDGAGLGELLDFFWKKPRMDFWLLDCEPDGGCFFCEGRGVDISLPSTPRTMAALWDTSRERMTSSWRLKVSDRSYSLVIYLGKERVGVASRTR